MGRGGEIRIRIWWENMKRPPKNPRATRDNKTRINIKNKRKGKR
jgi:hypothetical protein